MRSATQRTSMPFPNVMRGRTATGERKEGESKARPTSMMVIGSGGARTNATAQLPPSHHRSPGAVLPPPETPTRTLLQRIQRRSSTSAEFVAATGRAASRVRPSGTPAAVSPKASTTASKIATSALSVSRTSEAAKELQSFGQKDPGMGRMSSLPRHVRTTSMMSVRSMVGSKALPRNVAASKPLADGANNTVDVLFPSRTPGPSTSTFIAKSMPVATPSSDSCKSEMVDPPKQTISVASKSNDERVANPSPPPRSLATPLPSPSRSSSLPPVSPSGPSLPSIDPVRRSLMLNSVASNGTGLTRDAALSLEQEFASQERILQGLQRDNERKCVEVEEVRRQKARLEEFLARQFGQDHWKDVVFGSQFAISPKTVAHGSAILSTTDMIDSLSGKRGAPPPPSPGVEAEESIVDQSSTSQAVVEDLLRTLSDPSLPSSPTLERKILGGGQTSVRALPTSPLVPSHSTPMKPARFESSSVFLSPAASRPVMPHSSSTLLLDASYATTLDDASFVSVPETILPQHGATKDMVYVPRAALQAMFEAQKVFAIALEGDSLPLAA